jgi:hypothetical protein
VGTGHWLCALRHSPAGSVTAGALVVAVDHRRVTGYALLEAAVPTGDAGPARAMAGSRRASGRR